MFRVGQKVVCIGLKRKTDQYGVSQPHPMKGDICIVEEVFTWNGEVYIRLRDYPSNIGYAISDFRPLDESFAEETLARITEEVKQEEVALIINH